MWIITKNRGIFNTDQIGNIVERDGVTYAQIGESKCFLSHNLVLEKIIAGLRADLDLLEVE